MERWERGVKGTVYLLHFKRRYPRGKRPGHYIGWTEGPVEVRLAEHEAGRGARLLEVVRAFGITWELARTWEGTRNLERLLKSHGGASRMCPTCNPSNRRAQFTKKGKKK